MLTDGFGVNTWQDKSSHNNHATVSTNAEKPAYLINHYNSNSRNALDFDGNDDILNFPDQAVKTMILVYEQDTNESYSPMIAHSSNLAIVGGNAKIVDTTWTSSSIRVEMDM